MSCCLKCGWIPGLRPTGRLTYTTYRLLTGTFTVYSISTKAHTSWLRNSFSWHAVADICCLRQKTVIFHDFHNLPLSQKLDPRLISVTDCEQNLSVICVHKAVGPDNIPNWIIKDFSYILDSPIAAIYNSSVKQSYVPPSWKQA